MHCLGRRDDLPGSLGFATLFTPDPWSRTTCAALTYAVFVNPCPSRIPSEEREDGHMPNDAERLDVHPVYMRID